MSLVVASEDDTSDQNGKLSTPPHLTLSTSTIVTTRKNFPLAITSVLMMLHLSRDQLFCLTWPAHNFLITLPASPPAILFQFEHKIASLQVHLFHTYKHIL